MAQVLRAVDESARGELLDSAHAGQRQKQGGEPSDATGVPAMRGRVMALWSVAMIGSTPIGGPIVGWIGEHVGARWGIAIGGFSALFMVLYAFAVKIDSEQSRKISVHIKTETHQSRLGIHKLE